MVFTLERDGFEAEEFTVNLPGEHNVLNALAAIGVALTLDISLEVVKEALKEFTGVGRRFSVWGEAESSKGNRFTVVDDYGHHPTEMAATIAAARGAYPGRRLFVAFQPHRYSRTRDCFEDLVRVLSKADALVLESVYPAGEERIIGADSRSLCRAIRLTGKVEPMFANDNEEALELIDNNVRDGDVLLAIGAGNIGELPARLMKKKVNK